MKWQRIVAIGAAALVGILVMGAIGIWVWRPWVPKLVVEAPGPGGQRITEGGLLANWYPVPNANAGPAVLMFGGSEGGIGKGTGAMAHVLNSNGISVLAISYFRGPDQPSGLEAIPLETFDRGLAWLRGQSQVDPRRIGLMGGSKGAEAALLVATRHPEIVAVVASMPSSAVWQGVNWNTGFFGAGDGSSWSSGGKPLPYLALAKFVPEQGPISVYASLSTLPAHPAAAIPIERSRAQVLLICGEDDVLWPSCPMARQLKARAAARSGPVVTILAYADAGHGGVFGLPAPPGDPRRPTLAGMGGTLEGNAAARDDAWPKAMKFLATALGLF